MDVNGARYQLLLGEDDLRPMLAPTEGAAHVAWNGEIGAVTLEEHLLLVPAASGQPARPDLRRGAAVDRYGHWYSLAEDEAGGSIILQQSEGRGEVRRFWPREDDGSCRPPPRAGFRAVSAPPSAPRPVLRGLTVTREHYLIVGALAPAGLWVFDLHAGGPPLVLDWPASVPFAPFDLAPRPDGGAWILDRAEDGTQRYWAIDGRLAVIPTDQPTITVSSPTTDAFRALDGSPARTRLGLDHPAGIELGLSSPVDVPGALAIEALPDGSVLILAAGDGSSTVSRHRYGAMIGTPIALEPLIAAVVPPPPRPLVGQDFARLPAADGLGILLVASSDGDQAFAFDLRDDVAAPLVARREHYPMRLFGMRALVHDAVRGHVYYDSGERWVPLGALPKPRFAAHGALAPWIADGRAPGCVWHRLFIDGCIPPGTRVLVETRAADERDLLASRPWLREPAPYLRPRGRELQGGGAIEGGPGAGTWELLFQAARGRYLAIRLTLTGNGRSTPSVRALRAYYPRFSYLAEYLPAIYRQDEASASFLDRFLANVEGLWTELEGRIAAAQSLFDVRTVPAEYVEWLGSWMGAIVEPIWSEAQRRVFVANAPLVFQQRGTVRGLENLLRLAIDPCVPDDLFSRATTPARGPRIREQFRTRGRPRLDPRSGRSMTPSLVEGSPRWTPAAGGAELHRAYRAFLEARWGTVAEIDAALGTSFGDRLRIRFSPVPPANAALAEVWRMFIAETMDFDYADLGPEDVELYRGHLRRHYRTFDELARAYGMTGALDPRGFSSLELPGEDALPADGAPLADWLELVSTVVPIARAAHRFTALVPASPDDTDAEIEDRLARARVVIERERPAHTDYRVELFWDLLRVGTVQVGVDAEIGPGSRYVAVLLGGTRLADGYLSGAHPFEETDRVVVGRDSPTTTAPLT